MVLITVLQVWFICSLFTIRPCFVKTLYWKRGRIYLCFMTQSLHFPNAATTLTSWHLLVTFCSLHVALWMKLFEHKPFDPRTVIGFGILNGISIGLLNLSLGFNSVGFYQVGFIIWTFISLYVEKHCGVSELWLYNFCVDDQAGNHPLHCAVGDPLLEQEIQVFFFST